MSEWLLALIVYGVIGLIILLNRKKFVIMSKVIVAYKTKKPIAWMEKLSKAKRLWKVYSTICIPIGFYYLVIVFYGLLQNAIGIIFTPGTSAGVAPVIPGVQIPGSPIYIPLFYGLISIGILAFVHEFAHGIIMRVENIKIKSSGFGLALIFPFFFVEQNETDFNKSSKLSKLRVISAGASTNILLSMGLMLLLSVTFLPFFEGNLMSTGVKVIGLNPGFPAENAGVKQGELIIGVNNETINNLTELSQALTNYLPGETINIITENNTYSLTLTSNPSNESLPYMGVSLQQLNDFTDYARQKYGSLLEILMVLYELLFWIATLNFLVGLVNLLPMWFIDGGIMLYNLLGYVIPEKYLNKVISVIFNTSLLLLIINILPFFSTLFASIIS